MDPAETLKPDKHSSVQAYLRKIKGTGFAARD